MHSTPRRIAALAAVLGLPLSVLAISPASAGPLSGQTGTGSGVVLVSALGGAASTAHDGTNTTVRLEALGRPWVSKVRFEYTTDPAEHPDRKFTAIETVTRNDDGAFAAEWSPGSFPLGVFVRPVAIDGSGDETPGPDEKVTVSSSARSVNVSTGSLKGYFRQPYVLTETEQQAAGGPQDRTLITVSGTLSSSNTAEAVTVGWLKEQVNATGAKEFAQVNTQSTTPSKGGPFTIILPIGRRDAGPLENYDFTGDPDQIAIQATVGTVDDVEAFTLYEQKVTTVSAVADRSTVTPGETAAVTVTVVDQSGAPIPGAQVVDATNTSDIRYTDETGRVDFDLAPGTRQYYANTTSDKAYSSTEDKISNQVTVSASSTQSQSRLVATSTDGSAFDLDEVDNTASQSTGNPPLPGSVPGDGDPTDVTVQIVSATGSNQAPGSGQALGYYWNVTPFGGGTPVRHPASGTSTGTHEGGGKYDVLVPAGGNGTYELFAQLSNDAVTGAGVPLARVLTVRAGQAAILWDRPSPESASAGDAYTVTGRLALPDGTALPGRALDLSFQRDNDTTDEDPTPDAGFDEGASSPTTSLLVTTDSSGAFAAPLRDPVESPQRSELGGSIDATSASNAVGNAGASALDHVVNFTHDTVPAALRITESREGAQTRPGEFTLYTVKVVNRLGGGIADQSVALITDGGYFSRAEGSATSPTPASTTTGTDVGGYRDDGRSTTLTTGPDGTARVFLAMGRDSRFDDDGALTTTVSGLSGTLTASDSHAWTTEDPLNGGTVTVLPSTGSQDSGNLPAAQTADEVVLDVVLTDGFGNPVPGEAVTLVDDSGGKVSETDGTADDGLIRSDLDRTGDLVLSSEDPDPQQLTATWTASTLRYAGTPATPTSGSETLTGVYTVGWYDVDHGASTYSLTPDGSERSPVGSSVTLTYLALDQKGEPVPGLFVTFDRAGPRGASGTGSGLTGQDGRVSYTFVGRDRGRATITATPRLADASGDVVDAGVVSRSVTFGPPLRISARLTGSDNGRADDRLVLRTATAAVGATARLFKIDDAGRRSVVGTGVVGSDGVAVLIGPDGGRSATTYVARVVGNDAVRRTTSNEIKVR